MTVIACAAGCGGGGGGGDEDADAGDTAQDTADALQDGDALEDGDLDAPSDTSMDELGDVPADETGDEADAPSDPDFEWDAPEFPDRYGFFQVQQITGPTGAVSFAGGDFGDYSSVVPSVPLWAGDGCTVVVYDDDPPDAAGFSRLSAGTPVAITGGTGIHSPISCAYDALEGYVCDVPATAGTTLYGTLGAPDVLSFVAPGGDVVAFDFSVEAPPPLTITSDIEISKSAGYTVTWSAVDAGGVIIAIVTGDYATSLDGGRLVQCSIDLTLSPGATSFDVPLPALDLLDTTGAMLIGLMQVMSTNSTTETLSDSTVVEALVMNGAALQVEVTD